jgi:hypothetical protein
MIRFASPLTNSRSCDSHTQTERTQIVAKMVRASAPGPASKLPPPGSSSCSVQWVKRHGRGACPENRRARQSHRSSALAALRPDCFIRLGKRRGRPWGNFGSRGRGHLVTHFWEKNEPAWFTSPHFYEFRRLHIWSSRKPMWTSRTITAHIECSEVLIRRPYVKFPAPRPASRTGT